MVERYFTFVFQVTIQIQVIKVTSLVTKSFVLTLRGVESADPERARSETMRRPKTRIGSKRILSSNVTPFGLVLNAEEKFKNRRTGVS